MTSHVDDGCCDIGSTVGERQEALAGAGTLFPNGRVFVARTSDSAPHRRKLLEKKRLDNFGPA